MAQLKFQTVSVVGAGTMGAGIAQTLLAAGCRVHLIDNQATTLSSASASLEKRFRSLHEKGKLTEPVEGILSRLSLGTLDDAPPFDLLIEAIAEIADVKQGLFHRAYQRQPQAVFASNTSSLSIDRLAEGFLAPDRFVGLHFFNPAPLMPLVEVVQGKQTSAEVVAACINFCREIGKTPVQVKDSPGFIVNRVARPFYAEMMRIVEQANINFDSADAAIRAQGFKMGAFELMDLIGLDINYNVTRLVWEGLNKPHRFTPNPIQGDRVAAGRLGQKTGKGFYEYDK